jgi:hypothetical protein
VERGVSSRDIAERFSTRETYVEKTFSEIESREEYTKAPRDNIRDVFQLRLWVSGVLGDDE